MHGHIMIMMITVLMMLMIQSTDELMESLQTTGNTLGRLKLSQVRLQNDAANKRAAAKFDSSVMRMRKRQMAN